MYIAFNYKPKNGFYDKYLNKHLTCGNELYNSHKKEVQNCLSNFISEDGVIQGSELKQNWFSIKNTDVFISHSHKDVHRVKAFAGFLHEKFGLSSFIDSCAWGYCDELLKKIDDEYCYNSGKGTYNYNLRNYTTTHVHMMLSTALTEMLDRSECVIFFNTPNSIIMKEELDSIRKKSYTVSPWILYELTMISKMRRVTPDRRTFSLQHEEFSKRRDDFKVEYDVSKELKRIPILTDEHLKQLVNDYVPFKHALDELYNITLRK